MILESVNAMETTFNLKDVIYICSFVGSGVLAWSKMQRDKDRLSGKIESIEEKMVGIGASKKAMKGELILTISEKDQILHARIDRVRDDNIKSYEKLELKIEELNKNMMTNTTRILEALNK